MKVNDLVAKMKTAFKNKYSYLTESQVVGLYNCSLNLYLSLSFPLDRSITEIPQEYARDVGIIRRIMTETLEREGLSSVTAYSENGMNFTFDNAHISRQLLSTITPKAKVVNKK
jgi:hypothetical protein